jgi:flagellar protein FlaF
LPSQLRAQLFWLAEFTETHSRKVLAGQATVAPLLEVNTAVLRGLRNDGPVG